MNAPTWTRLAQEARALGINQCVPLDPRELVADAQVRAYCAADRCGSYGRHPMCPPALDARSDIADRVHLARAGALLQWMEPLDVRNDSEGLLRTKRTFHRAILSLERRLEDLGFSHPWGLIGSTCALCTPCGGLEGCTFPDLARPSLEALGVDVMALLRTRNLDTGFHPDRITWTGALLLQETPGP